jgi:hypothetical protein
MKRLVAFCLLLVICPPAFAVENEEVMYAGGTVASLKDGAVGRLDTTSAAALSFEFSGGKLAIPYAKIDSYEFSENLARHLGVLPAVGVALIRKRQHRHYLRLVFHDETGEAQVAIFEIPKATPRALLAVIQTRAPLACKWPAAARCREVMN